MQSTKNILFIMCDQLRYDYLGCTGHPTIRTPNIDKLAARGVTFTNSYCQSPTCGPSRSSVYTGRYVSSNGTSILHAPLRVGEMNIGHHLNPLGVRTVLTGKSHMVPDQEGMERLGIDPQGPVGSHLAQAGWEPYERDDGIHLDAMVKPDLAYNKYLRDKGYGDDHNPWHWVANAVETKDGVRSGYFNDQVDLPARVKDEDSETAFITRRAMDFMAEDDGEAPWVLHLSYIKPHWPYVAPAPYHNMYSAEDVPPAIRADGELDDPNELIRLFRTRVAAKTFSRQEAREKIIPAYMGLITQIDDQLGILFDFMDEQGLLDNTMIVFTSDHGDYLGDHWMGDKEHFHDPSVKVPLIVADPSAAADATRGASDDALVELVDLLPTFLEYFGGEVPTHVLDGCSLMPRLRGEDGPWRDFAISECDFSFQIFGLEDGRNPLDCRSYMIATKEWKYIYAPQFDPVLFDLINDPDELVDLGTSPDHADIRQMMLNKLAAWSLQYRQRVACSEQKARHISGIEDKMGVLIGYWNEDDAKSIDPAVVPNIRRALRIEEPVVFGSQNHRMEFKLVKQVSLEQKINNAGGALNMLRGSELGTVAIPGIPGEFTNWRDEQRAWRTSVCLLEQSYHMTELHLRGADAKKFVTQYAANRMDNLTPMRAKQLVLTDETGYMVSDCILFCEEEDFLRVVGPPTASNWLQFHADGTDLSVEATRNENMIIPRERRDVFRFQLQGPNALDLVREIADDGLPEIKFFHMGEFSIAGQSVRALRHGMAGQPGFEIYGPWDAQTAVRAKIEEKGASYGLRKAGSLAYQTSGQESGWMARPVPAIYAGDHNKDFREWLPARSFEGGASIGGSFVAQDISEHFVEPYELGYGKMVNFDHEFVGRDALMARKTNARTKVTLELNPDDVFRVMKESVGKEHPRTKFISLPVAHYSSFHCDQVMMGGSAIGHSQMCTYSSNAGALLTTALVDNEAAEIGREVSLLWGEPNSTRKTVEEHKMTEIRAKIKPVPYFEKVIKRD